MAELQRASRHTRRLGFLEGRGGLNMQERAAQYQLLAEWKAEEQAQWERAAAAKEDDNLALERYRKQVPSTDAGARASAAPVVPRLSSHPGRSLESRAL